MEKSDHIVGTWVNELKSVMKIDSCSPEGKISGSFKPAKGEEPSEKEHHLVGFWHKEKQLVAFTVMYADSITSWIGHLKGDTLEVSWTLQRSAEWDGKHVGANMFKKK